MLNYSVLHDKNRNDIPFLNIENRKIYKWVDDTSITKCYNCELTFNFYYRKHHCRSCGRIFCYKCSEKKIYIPLEMQVKSQYETNDPMMMSRNKTNDEARVCDKCYDKVIELNKLNRLIEVFYIMNFTIPELLLLRCVCHQWRQVANYFLSKIREIQYYLSDHKYSDFDKRVLWNNRYYVMGHSQWMVQLLKSIDYEDYGTTKNKLDEVKKLISDFRGIPLVNCYSMMCSRQCNKKLSSEDSLSLLDSSIKSRIIKEYAIRYLDNANMTEMTCYIPFFIHHLKYESIENSIIGEYFIRRCVEYSKPVNNLIDPKRIIFINEFYWNLKLCLNDSKYVHIYRYFIDKLDDELNSNLLKIITSGENFINIFKSLPSTPMTENEIRAHFKRELSRVNRLSIPLNPFINDIEINISNITVKNSATKPIQIPLKYKFDSKTYNTNYLYKKEDIRKDKIIMNIIKLIDLILKREEGLDLNILTYNIHPINHQSGIIEFVPDCNTIYDIKEKMKFSILNYIIENNKNETIKSIQDKFMKSCSAYCVITFLLGIGDRHLENIMITKDGKLFHIDYSYILGFDAKPMTPRMRITPDMVDTLGGENSECYDEFKKTCYVVYNCLRRHINLFINMLSLLSDISPEIENRKPFTRELIKRELLKRFIPGENNKQAELQLYNYIDSSSKDYKYAISDIIHYYSQESEVIDTAKNLVNGIYGLFG